METLSELADVQCHPPSALWEPWPTSPATSLGRFGLYDSEQHALTKFVAILMLI